jgi:polysaccharide biosynthesis transport protein
VPAMYRYVVIDTPPILAASEAMSFARASDHVLLCALRDVSRVNQVAKAREQLLAARVHLSGAVFSGVPIYQYQRRYGDYPVLTD